MTGQAAAETVTIVQDPVNTTEQDVTGGGFGLINISGAELIRYTGAGANDTLRVNTGNGNDTVRVEGGNSFDLVTSNSLPAIEYTGLNTFVLDAIFGIDTATFATHNLNGALDANYQVETSGGDTLIIEGADAINDSFTLSNPVGANFLAVVDNTAAGAAITVTNTSALSQVGLLRMNTLGGNDTVNVFVSPNELVSVPTSGSCT